MAKPKPTYAPCPKCDSDSATKIGFTWWGGVLGPSLLTHVKCDDCGTAYNGKTGKSNLTAIIIYQVIAIVIVLGLMAVFAINAR